jgi:glycosyltransferase involved in cell wall biosynthesis
MRIVLLSYFHGYGGAEKQTVLLANALAKNHDVTIISICADDCKYEIDVKVRRLFIPDKRNNLLRVVYRYLEIRKILNQLKPDITISFWFQPVYLVAYIKKSITGHVIYSERGDPDDKEYSGLLGIVRRFTLKRIDGFVFQTHSARKCFDKKVFERSIVIPNALSITTTGLNDSEPRRKAIVTVGRLCSQKNHKMAVDAFAKVNKIVPEFTLEIYGEGEQEEFLTEYIKEKGLNDSVSIYTPTADIHSRIKDATMFVLSSEYEGMPNVLLEAMALGLPCISTDYRPGGVKELIVSGENGIIVPNNDCNAMAEAILSLLFDENQMRYIGRNAKKAAIKYSPDSCFDKWEGYLNKFSTRI